MKMQKSDNRKWMTDEEFTTEKDTENHGKTKEIDYRLQNSDNFLNAEQVSS